MNLKHKITWITASVLLTFSPGCNDLLEEEPKTSFTNAYFETSQGIQDGINTAYSFLRFQYGTNPALGLNVTGTDEYTYGPEPNYNGSGDNLPHKLLGTYDVTPSAGYLLVTFNRTFPIINMLNGLLEFAPDIEGLTQAERTYIMAQARYLRAHYYYLLVGQFGAVPLDLGGGELQFNTIPYTGFNRLDPDLLAKNYQVMIDDLTWASENLIDARPTNQFRLSKAVALHLLSKIYLFRAYSEVAQAGDFQNAYDVAMELINNQGKYGAALQQDFGEVFRQGNDYNTEILFASERIPGDHLNNGYPATGPSGIGDVENMAANCFTSNYEQPTLNTPAGADVIDGRPFEFQRPLRKLAPTEWLLHQAFADKVNDSRYHNTFRTLYTVNTQERPGSAAYQEFVDEMADIGLALGDTAFYLADTEAQAAQLQGKYYPVYGPSVWYTNQRYPDAASTFTVYPSLKKFNDVNRGDRNDASGRPMPIFRLAETYLNAAEAAFRLSDPGEAADLINVLRTRAAYRPNLDAGELQDRIDAMQVTAGDITIDFILDERARELCGESLRWVDLAARGDEIFVNRVRLNADAGAVQAYHRRRPIPQEQLDRISDPNKAQYQNTGY